MPRVHLYSTPDVIYLCRWEGSAQNCIDLIDPPSDYLDTLIAWSDPLPDEEEDDES